MTFTKPLTNSSLHESNSKLRVKKLKIKYNPPSTSQNLCQKTINAKGAESIISYGTFQSLFQYLKFQHHNQVILVDHCVFLYHNFFNGCFFRRRNGAFHFHGLNHKERGVFIDFLSDFHQYT